MWGKRGLAVQGGCAARLSGDVSDRESGKIMRGEPAHALSIETAGFVKRYGSVVALDHVDLAVPRAAVGLLGPNGAGKSTLLKILLGLSRPDGGSARVLSRDAIADGRELRMRVGYMPETDTLPDNATASDFVTHMAEMSRVPRRAARQRAADVLYQVGLDEERYRLVKGFSTGMKQRVKLAQSIVHDPGTTSSWTSQRMGSSARPEEMPDLIGRINRRLGILVVSCTSSTMWNESATTWSCSTGGGLSHPNRSMCRTRRPICTCESTAIRDRFLKSLEELGLLARPAGIEYTSDEFVVARDSDQALDAIRDAAAMSGSPLRLLRPAKRSLEDLYVDSVGAGAGADGARDRRRASER